MTSSPGAARPGRPSSLSSWAAVLGRELGAGSKGNHWDAWPEDLRVREFPRAAEGVPA